MDLDLLSTFEAVARTASRTKSRSSQAMRPAVPTPGAPKGEGTLSRCGLAWKTTQSWPSSSASVRGVPRRAR